MTEMRNSTARAEVGTDISMSISLPHHGEAPRTAETVIRANRSAANYWGDLWRFRDLIVLMAWRDVLVRYKQTVLGIAWAWIRPLITMLVFTLIFGKLARLPSNNIPYGIFVFAALLPWQLFSNALSACSTSVVDNTNIVGKIYFPRIILPVSGSFVSLIDALVASVLLLALMIWTGVLPGWRIVFLPVFLSLAYGLALGAGLWISALNVKYRDFKYIVPFVIQIGQYISPVGFSSELIPAKWHLVYGLNPMVGIIVGFRWALFGEKIALDMRWLAMSVIAVIALLITGTVFFRRTERTFADVI